MNKILVPIDFSECSAHALEVAATLAKDSGASILVLHMLGLSEAILTKNEAQEFMEAKFYMMLTKKRFAEFLDKDYLKAIKVNEMVQNYRIFEELNKVALEQNVDLIVMGSHGTGGLGKFFVGSNTEKVVRTSEVPVLVIKERISSLKMDKVVFACDFKIESVPAYHRAQQMFRPWSSKLYLVYINLPHAHFKSTQEIEQERDAFLRVAHHGDVPGHIQITHRNDYSTEEGLYNYADELDADLIAIPTHGRRGLSHFFQGSIGEDLANRANLPVMTFKI
ncbi:universal stress protein [Ulvibacterium sp.]|uniref:universal stress protein n=1 Tax=Ulvibacterium sp. TaxID=2665914 RepID=UPI00262041AD|nr:universal stress protein [Ulvibacterium sp.]